MLALYSYFAATRLFDVLFVSYFKAIHFSTTVLLVDFCFKSAIVFSKMIFKENLVAIKSSNQYIQSQKNNKTIRIESLYSFLLAGVEEKMIWEEKMWKDFKILGQVRDSERKLLKGLEKLFNIGQNIEILRFEIPRGFCFDQLLNTRGLDKLFKIEQSSRYPEFDIMRVNSIYSKLSGENVGNVKFYFYNQKKATENKKNRNFKNYRNLKYWI